MAREIQAGLIDCGQAAGVHPIDLLIAVTALGYGFTVLTDDGDYAYQIAAVRPDPMPLTGVTAYSMTP